MNSHFKPSMSEHSLVMGDAEKINKKLRPGEFPTQLLPKMLRELVAYYRENFGFPESATAMTALAVLSAAVGPMVQVANASEYGNTPLNTWTVIVGRRGSGKSQLIKMLGKPLFEFNRRMRSAQNALRDRVEAKLKFLRVEMPRKKLVNTGDDEALALETQRRIRNLESIRALHPVIGTVPGEALKKVVAETPDHFTAIVGAEGQEQLFIMFGKYADSGNRPPELDVFLAMKGGDYLNDTRICRDSVTVDRGLISMPLMVQPTVAKRLIGKSEAIDRGLLTRMFFFDPGFQPQPGRRRPRAGTPQEEFDRLVTHYLELREKIANPDLSSCEEIEDSLDRNIWSCVELIECDRAAEENFTKFGDEGIALEEDLVKFFPELAGECSRWREDAIKLSGLFALMDGQDLRVEGGCALSRWNRLSNLNLLLQNSPLCNKDLCQRVVDIIEDSGKDSVILRHLRKNHGISADNVHALALMHPETFRLETAGPFAKGGRPSEVLHFLMRF